jgi:gluconokinase
MKIPGLRAADEMVGGLAHFGRMLDKIRLAANGTLPDGYFLGVDDFSWWDARCCRFLGVDYGTLRTRVEAGDTDEAILQWCLENGSGPNEEQIAIWSTFILKRGWRDEATAGLEEEKQQCGFGHRDDIVTFVDLQKAQES